MDLDDTNARHHYAQEVLEKTACKSVIRQPSYAGRALFGFQPLTYELTCFGKVVRMSGDNFTLIIDEDDLRGSLGFPSQHTEDGPIPDRMFCLPCGYALYAGHNFDS